MITKFRVPQMSANVTEATVTAWSAEEGAKLRKGQALLELTTDKTAFEVEAPRGGVLRRIVAPVKSIVPVGYVLALIGPAGDALPDVEAENADLMKKHRARAGGARATRPAAAAKGRGPTRRAVRATPAARRLARDLGVDLADVQKQVGAEVVNEDMVRRHADGS